MATVVPINSPAEFTSHTKDLPSSALLVLYFHAPWAAPCAQMSTVLSALASTYAATQPPTISFLSINAEELPDISEDEDVTVVPYVVLKRDGKQLDAISGADAAKVRAAVEKHAGVAGSGAAKHQLPPAQQVTRPTNQPTTEPAAASSSTEPAAPTTNGDATTNGTSAPKPNGSSAAAEPSGETAENGLPVELNDRLTELTQAAPCMLFMKGSPSAPQCGFSRQLVSILRERGVRYGFFNILADEEVRQGMKTFAEWPTFPQLWLGGELVGGLDIVREELENDDAFFDEYSVKAEKANGQAAVERAQVAT